MTSQKFQVTRTELSDAINDLARAKSLNDHADNYSYGAEVVEEASKEYADASDVVNNLLDKLYGVNK